MDARASRRNKENINQVENSIKGNALHYAAVQGNADAVRKLLAIETDRDSYCLYVNQQGFGGRTALMWAAEGGHEEVVRVLITTGVHSGVAVRERDRMEPVTDKACYQWSDKEPVTDKARYQWSDKEAVTNKACYQWSDKEAVKDKACYQWSDKESVLHINARDNMGRTALMRAAEDGNASIIKLLLESGADVFTCDYEGDNALLRTARVISGRLSRDRQQIIETLIDCGLNANSQNFVGDDLLQINYRQADSFEVLNFLMTLTGNAALNVTNASGRTIVHAILSNLESNVKCKSLQKFLQPHDIDLRVRDIEQKTALDYITCSECRQRAIQTIPALNAHGDNQACAQSYKTQICLGLLYQPRSFLSVLCNARSFLGLIYKPRSFLGLLYKPRSEGSTIKEVPDKILEYWYRHILTRGESNHFSECTSDHQTFSYVNYLRAHTLKTDPIARDKRGRTYVHLVILLKSFGGQITRQTYELDKMCWDIEAVSQDIKKSINIADGCGRTALHYVAVFMWLAPYMEYKEDELLKKIIKLGDITARDTYDRTPLHYAAMSIESDDDKPDIYTLLVERGADVNVVDMFGETPLQMRSFSKTLAKFIFRNAKLLGSLEKEVLSYWKEVLSYWDNFCFPPECLPTGQNVTLSSVHVFNSLSANEACFNKDSESMPACFFTLHKEMLSTLTSHYYSSAVEYVDIIVKEVKALIDNLVSAVQAVDPKLKGHVLEVGSAYERTKTGFPNEFDFDVVLTEFSNVCEVSSSPVCPTGYRLLKRCRSSKNDNGLDEFFNDGKLLQISKVRLKYEHIVKKVIRKSEFWKFNKLLELNMADDSQIYICHPKRVCITFSIAVKALISGRHIVHPIWIDIVPCIKCIWPDAVKNACCKLKSDGCNFVFYQPQQVYPWIPVSIPYARVSFARAESTVIRSCPAVVKAAFVVAKLLFQSNLDSYRHRKKPTQSVASYVLKTAALHCMAAAARDKTKRSSRWSTNHETVTETELKRFNKKLFYCLMQFHQQGYVPSYFLHGYNIPTWNDEKFLRNYDVQEQLFYASLKGMPPFYITKCMREIPKHEPHRYKSTHFTEHAKLAHAMYWSCCEDGESVRLCNPYYVANPLVEYFNPLQLLTQLHDI